jgi:hypothetical protein
MDEPEPEPEITQVSLDALGDEFLMAPPTFVKEHEEKMLGKFLWHTCLPPNKDKPYIMAQMPLTGGAIIMGDEEIKYKVEGSEGPGFSAQILTWTDDSPTGRMIGKRNWYIGDKYLYVAVSVDELRVIKDDFFEELVGWPWKTAVERGIVTTVWYDRDVQPFFALRMDYFAKFHKRLEAVHKGKLPWLVTRTEDDDPKDG